jgi:hypothetical protein
VRLAFAAQLYPQSIPPVVMERTLFCRNVLLVLDRTVFLKTLDLSTWRLATALIALLPLLYGLIWEDE